jgi:hypothetical protein
MCETLAQIFKASAAFGLDLAWLLAFFAASAMSWLVNPIVHWLHQRNLQKESKEVQDHFDMAFAPTIGKLERVLYIYAIMYAPGGSAFAIISGWLVMKAFSVWLERTDARMRPYHLYLYGNALSLLAGLALGSIGLMLYRIILRLLG